MSKLKISLIVFVVFLIGLRLALPALLLPQINKHLASISDVAEGHVNGFGLALIRGAYHFDGLTLKSKVDRSGKEFLRADSVDVSVAWRELLHGHILADARIEGLTLIYGADISNLNQSTSKEEKKEDAKNLAHQIIPFDISRISFSNSRLLYHLQKTQEDFELLNSIEGQISHVSNVEKKNPLPSLINLKGNLFGGASIMVTGSLWAFQKPIKLHLRIKSEGFHLENANRFLLGVVPLSFAKGTLNLFSEFKYENRNLKGYAKPFFHNIKVIPQGGGKFVSLKHFFVETGAALANILLRNGETKTTAALVEFSKPENGEFNAQISKIFSTAFHNGYVQALPEGFQNSENIN